MKRHGTQFWAANQRVEGGSCFRPLNRLGMGLVGWGVWLLAFVTVFSGICVVEAAGALAGVRSFFVDYADRPDPATLRAHEVVVVHPEADVDVEALRSAGCKVYAYLSVVEIAAGASYRSETVGFSVVGVNPVWKSALMDIGDAKWRGFVLDRLAGAAAAKGFDGFFLDTADSVELLAREIPARATGFREGLVTLVKDLKARHPGKGILMNRGLSVWESLKGDVDGVLVESMFQTGEVGGERYRSVPEAESLALQAECRRVQSAGIQVFVLDYVDPRRPELAYETAARIEALGFRAMVGTPELNGAALAPLRAVARRVLVLFGRTEAQVETSVIWPAESNAALESQIILEWMGYELDYVNPSREELPELTPGRYAAILLDRQLAVPPDHEQALGDWLVAQRLKGNRLILLGGIPLESEGPRRKLMNALGMRGEAKPRGSTGALRLLGPAPGMNFEAEVMPVGSRFMDLQAPEGATQWLTVVEPPPGAGGAEVRFEAVFTTPWGGAAMDPYLIFRRPDFTDHWLLDPFRFFGECLGLDPKGVGPVPDSTTRDGLRIFFTHIDGDGFRHLSSVEAGRRSPEIVMERVLMKYPFPVTVSVIEAEMRGWVKDQPAGEAEQLQAIARRIFALPQVEVASHTYSHPFYWIPNDRTSRRYAETSLQLVAGHETVGTDLVREIDGSVDYIQQNLVSSGKRVEALLWSGNCRPPPEALKRVRVRGLVNLNGGMNQISKRYPTLTAAGPRGMPWGQEYQVYAVNDNENVYQQREGIGSGKGGAFLGGFVHVTDAFERTGSPRRLKPVNVYYHFYSGDSPVALSALTRALDWATNRPLHAMTAAGYARVAADARGMQVFRKRDGSWRISGFGDCRTLRMPSEVGGAVPNLASSRGVTGWHDEGGQRYLHLDGRPVVDLVIGRVEGAHLRLDRSSAEVVWRELKPDHMRLAVQDLRPVRLVIGGAKDGTTVKVRINGELTERQAGADGTMEIVTPPRAEVDVGVGVP